MEPSKNGTNGDGRDERGRFAPGWKGGPGNPRAAVTARLRAALDKAITERDVHQAVETIRTLMKDETEKGNVRLAAAQELLDRACGKAIQGDLAERLEQLEQLVNELEQA